MKRECDVIYHRQNGFVLTLDVLVPEQSNGRGILMPASGGWGSAHTMLEPQGEHVVPESCKHNATMLLDAGYTLFCIVHGAQPRFTVDEIIDQLFHALSFIRRESSRWGIDPSKLGALGGSSAGHLSMMLGTQAREDIAPVAAVVTKCPPLDFLNYGAAGRTFDTHFRELLAGKNTFAPAFQLREANPDNPAHRIRKEGDAHQDFLRSLSPLTYVDPRTAATLIFHGSRDEYVPLQQSDCLRQALEESGVPTRLYVNEETGHAWEETEAELSLIRDWFDQHLGAKL